MYSPDLTEAYPLQQHVIDRFRRDGFIHLRDVLTPDTLQRYADEISAKVVELNTMRLPLSERSTYHKAFLQVTNIWRESDIARELVFSRRLARIAAELLGSKGVRLYHDQALYKEPGGGITPWHADQYYWPFASDRTITVWIPLQDTPRALGSLEFAVGSHRFEYGRDLPIGAESERELGRVVAAQGFQVDSSPYALGDASFHLGWTFHRAGPNRATVPRRVMTVIYVDADIVVSEPRNDNQRGDLLAWLPGAKVGGVPDGELNPVLHRG